MQNLKAKGSLKTGLLVGLFFLSLVFAQGVDLLHEHTEPTGKVDCTLCLSLGLSGHAAVASGISIDFSRALHVYYGPELTLVFQPRPTASARAPPHFS